MFPALVGSIGLMLDIFGVILLFIWGPPVPNMEGTIKLALESGTRLSDGTIVGELERQQLDRRRLHSRMSKVALATIAMGFAVQLIAQWL
jgi:hypothetical protein